MKRIGILCFLCAAFLLLAGCRDDSIENPSSSLPAEGYLDLLQAYEDGRVFVSAKHVTGGCQLSFEDGYSLKIPETSFMIHDCTSSRPETVKVSDGWWMVGETVYGIKADSSVPDKEAVVIYAYFDMRTLYLHLSNRKLLEFKSPASIQEDDLARLQNIPVVRINTAGKAPIRDKKNYVDGTISISDPEKLYSETSDFKADMGIRGRGNSTWSWPKKPWKVKLKEKASILGMPADKEWALLANYADRTLMRNMVAMRLSEICGFSWTPRMRSVEVYLNDEYQGVYTFCEHKKVSSGRVDIDIVGEEDDSGDALTGGYYFEIEENQDETTCWFTSMGVPMMFSDPEVPTDRQFEYVRKWFDDFEEALYSADVTAYEDFIDVDSFINYYIVQELTKNVDGNLRKSSFITKERGKKMEMYHLWDFDLTLGNCGYFDGSVGNGPENFWIKDYTSGCWRGDNWFNRMMKDPGFVLKLQKRWNSLMPELEAVLDFIDHQALVLEPAQKRNFERWSIHESVDWVMFPSLGSYEKEVEYLKEFYTKRLEWLDREINRL